MITNGHETREHGQTLPSFCGDLHVLGMMILPLGNNQCSVCIYSDIGNNLHAPFLNMAADFPRSGISTGSILQ